MYRRRERTFARWQFEQSYAKWCAQHGRYDGHSHATHYAYLKGRETHWRAYEGLGRRLRATSDSFRTTNSQRAAQLAGAGRPRCERTVRRVHRNLEAMGLVQVRHVKRSGAARRPGELDCLSIRFLSGSCVRPRSAELQQESNPPQGLLSAVGAATSTTKSTTEIAPHPAADDVGPPPAAPPASHEEERERAIGDHVSAPVDHVSAPVDHVSAPPTEAEELEGIEAQIRFAELKLAMGWGPADRREIAVGHLRAQARQLRASTPPPRPDSGDRNTAP